MAALGGDLRGQLERSIVAAREESERAARAALETLGLERREAFPSISDEDRRLRVQLRTRARQLGEGNFEVGIEPLVEEIAYEGWHRMLFARFLAENSLLMHPSGVAVTLEECAELAREEGEPDAWMVAARYASAMLPGIFRQDDPSSRVRFAPEGRNGLERILNELPLAVFKADDALGWVYQFWQSKAKKAVNDSGVKIGAKELPVVTQLFTEDYMVRFLLENSLGAWWASRYPESPLIEEWGYLRVLEDGKPAAGQFEGWPDRAADVTMMDPCCGSGHFLVAAFDMLRKMRMEEEDLSTRDAGDAVLRDNLHGLEIDARCTQIAAFALAATAWKAGGYRALPLLNVACSGIPVEGQFENWIKLSHGDVNLQMTLERLYELFRDAPTLGSLVDPETVMDQDRMFLLAEGELREVLEAALNQELDTDDPVAMVFGESVRGVSHAISLLRRTYTLIATNVPYLARGAHNETLAQFIAAHHPEAKADLATAFVERCRRFSRTSGMYSLVTPQAWLFLNSYKRMRGRLLREQCWQLVCRLGTGAFQAIGGEVVNVAFVQFSNKRAPEAHILNAIDVTDAKGPQKKAFALRSRAIQPTRQIDQLANPAATITMEPHGRGVPLGQIARTMQGTITADMNRFVVQFWEVRGKSTAWEYYQRNPEATQVVSGWTSLLRWEGGAGVLAKSPQARICGQPAWGHRGMAVAVNSSLPRSLYHGGFFDCTVAVMVPHGESNYEALAAFVFSAEFPSEVRKVDQALSVTESSFARVLFDVARWQRVADDAGQCPEPWSDDPTQWIFEGDPVGSTAPLQVAVARLLVVCPIYT